MKAILSFITLMGVLAVAQAQNPISVFVKPVILPEPARFSVSAVFTLEGSRADYGLGFGLDGVFVSSARLTGPAGDFTFSLGSRLVSVHSPGPWPNGYDGYTGYWGSFTVPEFLREDFLEGRTTIELQITPCGPLVLNPGAGTLIRNGVTTVPEPSSMVLLGGGFGALSVLARARLNKAKHSSEHQ